MFEYKTITPGTISVPELHGYLLGSVNPRPIAFVATIDQNGSYNLAPFSFFNVFGANPPILIFSPARRGKDNSTKDTYENIKQSGECTVNIVNYKMIHQTVLASTSYPLEIDEFKKAGFTPIKSELVKVPRVAESPSQMECKVLDILNYGELPGGGNMIVAEIVKMHVKTEVLNENGKIDAYKIDTVGRCGDLLYTRSNNGLFAIENPTGRENIGFDKMPERIKNSKVLTGNDLGQLGKVNELPKKAEITAYINQRPTLKNLLNEGGIEQRLHILAKKEIENGDVLSAWKILMANKV